MQAHALLLTGPHQLTWISSELPMLQADEVLIRTTTGAISIGAELPQYRGTARASIPAIYPHMTGYESVGIIKACGSDVHHLHEGQRVVSFYGHRTYAVVPAYKAIPIPDDIPDTLAILSILTCDVVKGIRKVAPQANEPVLVTGAGAIGLLTLFMLTTLDIHNIDIVEPHPERLTIAKSMAIRSAIHPQEIAQRQEDYAIGLECSSHNDAFALLQQKMRPNGRICILADGNLEALVLTPAFHARELLIVGSSDGVDYPGHAQWYFQTLRTSPYTSTLKRLFEHHTTAQQLPTTFEQLASGVITPIKVLVHYNNTNNPLPDEIQ